MEVFSTNGAAGFIYYNQKDGDPCYTHDRQTAWWTFYFPLRLGRDGRVVDKALGILENILQDELCATLR